MESRVWDELLMISQGVGILFQQILFNEFRVTTKIRND